MNVLNQTTVTEFYLLGFQHIQRYKMIIFNFFIIVYFMTISGNLMIICLVASDSSLQSPMYFLLSQLSLSDLLLTTDIVPNTLYIIWNEGGAMSFSRCITQFYFFVLSDAFECFLLTIMAYDRYLAICKPLRYNSLMNSSLCVKLIVISWLLGFSVGMFNTMSISQFEFCGTNIIDHFFCDFLPLKELSCSDTTLFDIEVIILCITVLLFPPVIIILSYVCIARVVFRLSTQLGREKAFSTCSSHLAVVSVFYGTIFGSYLIPAKGKSLTVSKGISLLYTVFTPLINPIIYSLRNKDINEAIKNKSNQLIAQYK